MSPELISILACPICPTRPKLQIENDSLKCSNCSAKFPIINGIPHLVAEESESAKKESK